MFRSTHAHESGEDLGFEDVLTLLFAAWTVTGHVSFLAGISLRHYWLMCAGLGVLAAGLWAAGALRRRRMTPALRNTSGHGRGLVTWMAMGLGIVLVLGLHRPDADDRIYVGQQMRALDAPEESFWAMADVKDYNAGYVMSSYEYVRAGFSWLTGTPVLASYYLVWPSLIAAMAVAYQSRLFRFLGVRSLAVAFTIWFVIMLAWGDTHRTPSNFGFVRMFQGKGALVWITIPAAQYYWLRFTSSGAPMAALLLGATLVAGTGFTPTGVPTGVLLAALFVVVTLLKDGRTSRGWISASVVGSAGVYPVLIGLLMRFYFGHAPDSGYLPPELLALGPAAETSAVAIPGAPVAPPTPSVVAPTPTPQSATPAPSGVPTGPATPPAAPAPPLPAAAIASMPVPATPAPPEPTPALPPTQDVSLVDVLLVLGTGWRGHIVIACLLAGPFVLRSTPGRERFGIYALSGALMLGLPDTSRLIGEASYTSFAWRWIFAIPFTLCATLAAERLVTAFDRRWTQALVTVAMGAAFALVSPLRVISAPNGTSFGRPHYKLPPGPEVALLGYDKPAIRDGRRLVSPATGARH